MPLFFVLAFLLSWPAWPLVILNPESSPLLPFGPLIAGSAAGLPLVIISHATVDTAAPVRVAAVRREQSPARLGAWRASGW